MDGVLIRETNLVFTRPLIPRKVTKRIIIHHTKSGDVSAETVHGWHLARKKFYGFGYHYLIRASGSIERGRPENMRGVHASRANANTIAIALTGNFELRPPTTQQMASLVRLVRDIRSRYQRAAMSAEDVRRVEALRDDIAKVRSMAHSPTVREWFAREFGGVDAYLDAQQTRVAEVLARTPLLTVVRHQDVGSTACPGARFPWATLQQQLERGTA